MNIRKSITVIAVAGVLAAGLACGDRAPPEPTQTPERYKTATPRPTPTIKVSRDMEPPPGYCRALRDRAAALLREGMTPNEVARYVTYNNEYPLLVASNLNAKCNEQGWFDN